MELLQEKNLQVHPKQMEMLKETSVQQMLSSHGDPITDAVLMKASAVQDSIKHSQDAVNGLFDSTHFQ